MNACPNFLLGPNIKADEQLLAVKGVWLLSHNSTCRIALYNNDALVKGNRTNGPLTRHALDNWPPPPSPPPPPFPPPHRRRWEQESSDL